MNPYPDFPRLSRRGAASLAAATFAFCFAALPSQAATDAAAEAPSGAAHRVPAAVAAPAGESAALPANEGYFQSALEGYQPLTDEKIIDWKQANDRVGAIGGWRVYAKEAEDGAAAREAAGPATGSPEKEQP